MTDVETNGGGRAVARRPDRTPLSQRDPVQLAQHFAASGFFKDARDMSKAVVKIVAGEELGIGPMASMTGIHIIEGKPSLSANLLATQVKRSSHYDYRPKTVSAQKVEIAFFEIGPEGREELGTSEFTIEQAKRAGLVKPNSGWVKYPEAMLFARALSQGVRWYCPDVTAGSPAYVPEELGAEVDQEGDPLPPRQVVVDRQTGHARTPEEFIAAQVEQIDAPEPLPDAALDQLMKGYEIAGPELGGHSKLDGLNILLGSLDIDGIDAGTDLRQEMARWTPEQAEAVNAEFAKVIDAADEAVDGEIVADAEAQATFEEQWEEAKNDAE